MKQARLNVSNTAIMFRFIGILVSCSPCISLALPGLCIARRPCIVNCFVNHSYINVL